MKSRVALLIAVALLLLVCVVGVVSAYGNTTTFQITASSSGNQVNYAYKIILSNETGLNGISGKTDAITLYTAGTTRPDWKDINFTDNAGNLIPFQSEPGSQTATSELVTVNFPVVNSTPQTFKFLYGNSSQTTNSENGYSTFPIFGDWTNYQAFNTSSWFVLTPGNVNTSAGVLNLTGTGGMIRSVNRLDGGIRLRFSTNSTITAGQHLDGFSNGTQHMYFNRVLPSTNVVDLDNGSVFTYIPSPAIVWDGGWHTFEIDRYGTQAWFYEDDRLLYNPLNYVPQVSMNATLGYGGTDLRFYKFASASSFAYPEPILSNFSNSVTFPPIPNFTRQTVVGVNGSLSSLPVGASEVSVIYDTNPQLITGTNVYKAWYTIGGNSYYSESLDRYNWINQSSPVVTGRISSSVLKHNNTYYFVGNAANRLNESIFYSPNGTIFDLYAANIILSGAAGTWDDLDVANTYMRINSATDWKILYEAKNQTGRFQIGLATSSDNGHTFTKYSGNPVILSSLGAAGGPMVVSNGTLDTVYIHKTTSGDLPTEIYRYFTTDWMHFTQYPSSPILTHLTPDEGAGNATGQVADPFVLNIGGIDNLFYTGTPLQTGPFHLKLAIDSDGIPTSSVVSQFTPSGPTALMYPTGQAFTDTSTGSPTAWNWSYQVDGVGTQIPFNESQNAYFAPPSSGNFTISLNASTTTAYNISTQVTWVNVSPNVYSGFNYQDLTMTPKYTLTLTIVDSATLLPIPVVTITDSLGYNQTTTTGVFTHSYDYGTVLFYLISSGYDTRSYSVVMDSNRTETVTMTKTVTTTQGSTTWYVPKTIEFRVVNYANNQLPGVNLTAKFNASSTLIGGTEDLKTWYGMNPTAANEAVNGTLIMSGITDTQGVVVLTMLSTLSYDVYVTSGGTTNYFNVHPQNSPYLLRFVTLPTADTTLTHCVYDNGNTHTGLAAPDPYNMTMMWSYQDTCGLTTAIDYVVKDVNNGSFVIYNYHLAPVTSGIYLNNLTLSNTRGANYIWYENATRSV